MQQLKGVHDISRVCHLSGSFYILPLSPPLAGITSCRHHQLQASPVAATTSCRHHQLQAPSCRHHQLQAPSVAGTTSCRHHQLQAAPPVAGTTTSCRHHQLQVPPVAGSTTSCRHHHQLQASPAIAGLIKLLVDPFHTSRPSKKTSRCYSLVNKTDIVLKFKTIVLNFCTFFKKKSTTSNVKC